MVKTDFSRILFRSASDGMVRGVEFGGPNILQIQRVLRRRGNAYEPITGPHWALTETSNRLGDYRTPFFKSTSLT